MKLNKETLLKQKFWVLLLVTLPLSLGAILLLAISVSDAISKERNKIEADLKKYTKGLEPKTPADIAAAREQADRIKEKEKDVWKQAYEVQKPIFLWPQAVETEFNFASGRFAQKIKVYRGKAELPAEPNKDRHIQGTVLESKGTYIEVEEIVPNDSKESKSKDKKDKENKGVKHNKEKRTYQLFRSMRVETDIPVEGDDKEKVTTFEGINPGDRVSVQYHEGKYFYEPLTNRELTTYRSPLNVYLDQIGPIIEQVEPMNDKGEGVVQLKGPPGWFYKKGEPLPARSWAQKFFTFLDGGWKNAGGDFSEEAWLAQEDLWVQKELYRLIRQANDLVSKFENVDKNDKAEDRTKIHTFRNPLWEIGVKWPVDNKLELSLKNRQNRRQKLDAVKFRIKVNEKLEPETISLGGDPLGPAGTPDAEKKVTLDLKNTSWKGIYDMEQVLTWETAAVKRIDVVSVGSLAADEYSHSQRTFADDQKALKKTDPNAPPPPPLQVPEPTYSGGSRSQGAKKGKIKIDIGEGNILTKHYLIRNRYWEFTRESRRIPVSLALIVDQDHIHRVQTAFSNSRLRFLTTQILLNRYTSSLRPQLPNATTGFGQQFFPGRVTFVAPAVAGADDMETNVEMAIYGIVTLYERYPPPLIEMK